jgi:putative oxidoreductase
VADLLWRSGETKVEGFSIREETFYLFREEDKVPLLPSRCRRLPEPIAEHLFPVLLLFGLASRLSALGRFGMTMVIQLFRGAWRLARTYSLALVAYLLLPAAPARSPFTT